MENFTTIETKRPLPVALAVVGTILSLVGLLAIILPFAVRVGETNPYLMLAVGIGIYMIGAIPLLLWVVARWNFRRWKKNLEKIAVDGRVAQGVVTSGRVTGLDSAVPWTRNRTSGTNIRYEFVDGEGKARKGRGIVALKMTKQLRGSGVSVVYNENSSFLLSLEGVGDDS